MLFIGAEDDLFQFELVPDIAEQLSAVLHGYLHRSFYIKHIYRLPRHVEEASAEGGPWV